MRVFWATIVAAVVVAVAAAVFLPASPAKASPQGLAVDVAQAAPAVGPGFVDSFTVTCATTATAIVNPGGFNQLSYTCQTPASAETGGTVLVAVGDSGIADPAFATRNSPVYSGDTIREFGGNVQKEFCRADTGTVTIFCRAMVGVITAP